MKTTIEDVIWHDSVLLSVAVVGNQINLIVRDTKATHHVCFSTKGRLVIDCTQDWGPSDQIYSFSYSGDDFEIQMQSGTTIRADNCEFREVRSA